MISVEEAITLVKNNAQPIQNPNIQPVINSVGYVLYRDVKSPINMPPFRQSAMDGYALHLHNKNTYTIIDEVKAGDGHHPVLKPGEAVRIFTGAAVPDTANSVIMQEKTNREDKLLMLTDEAAENDNIRPLGEQVKKGDLALKKGIKLTPAAIGFLTTLGITEIEVFSKPNIAIVTTGSELIEAGQPLPYGKIYESNSAMLQTALQSIGHQNTSLTKVKDNYQATLEILEKAISENDIILISGGISVGDYDFVGKALIELGVQQLFYKVKQKPGKPLFFGKIKEKLIFALPGNPASALSSFYYYVQLSIEYRSGNQNFKHTRLKARLQLDYIKKGTRAQFLKAIYYQGEVQILEGQSSAMLHTFALANAFVYIPADVNQVKRGAFVEVILLPNLNS
ncbi:MAG: molybdopterin molybdotransferase MoeA [Flavobacteriales bacterium]